MDSVVYYARKLAEAMGQDPDNVKSVHLNVNNIAYVTVFIPKSAPSKKNRRRKEAEQKLNK